MDNTAITAAVLLETQKQNASRSGNANQSALASASGAFSGKYAVELESVTKSYKSTVAVKQLSLQVPTGSVYGFIGPNGSGKSTTLRMIMRILMPDTGTVRVLGETTHTAANDRIGFLPEERGLYKKMQVGELLAFYARLKGMHRPDAAVADWLERMGLGDRRKAKVESLSKGMAQKVQIIATVIAKPDLVLLDEPFSGLDPVNLEVVRQAILDINRDGATIIFSTHDMSVAERMCDSIFMIYRGNKVLDGTMEQIQNQYGTDTLRVQVEGSNGQSGIPFDRLPGVQTVVNLGNTQELRLNPDADAQRILAELMKYGRVRQFEVTRPTLHDIFVRIAAPTDELADAARQQQSALS